MAEVEVTDEQAGEALKALLEGRTEMPEPAVEQQAQATEPEPSAEAQVETAAEPVQEAAQAETAESQPETETDDVASLKQRLESAESERTKEREKLEARMRAIQERSRANEDIVRQRYLRKSAVADKALKALRKSKTADGVPESEVEAVIQELESSMNPASPSYSAPPEPVREDQAIVLNDFLNEKGMDADEAASFGKWVRDDGPTVLSDGEQRIAGESLRGFLHLAHRRWTETMDKPDNNTRRNDAVEVVKAVQRTQRQAARAATTSAAAPRKQPAAQPKEIDIDALPEAERHAMLSKLIRESVEQNL